MPVGFLGTFFGFWFAHALIQPMQYQTIPNPSHFTHEAEQNTPDFQQARNYPLASGDHIFVDKNNVAMVGTPAPANSE